MKITMKSFTSIIVALALLMNTHAANWVDAARARATAAAEPYVKQGFLVRQEFWGGSLPAGQPTVVKQQLFKGNTYWFWLGSDEPKATVSIHVYDEDGKLCDAESWQKGAAAGVKVSPKRTGTYYFALSVESSPKKRTSWALAYGFK